MQLAQIAPDVNDIVQICTLVPPSMDHNIDCLRLQKTQNQIVPIPTTHLTDQINNNAAINLLCSLLLKSNKVYQDPEEAVMS